MKPSRAGRITAVIIGLLVLAIAGSLLLTWQPVIAPLTGAPGPFAAASISQGARMAALGGCVTCHTAADGAILAGGRPIPTSFGTIYSTNITPDPATGIGEWSPEAFRRAMRDGVNRGGQHLYPAFPYDHFTMVSDEDDAAIYAWLMTREPVHALQRSNQLLFPLNVRLILSYWKWLFLRSGPFIPDRSHDASWNRGAYLASGLGHCGACHTPRNAFGAERTARLFAGGETEDWNADAINHDSPSRIAWDQPALQRYLRDGWDARHGLAIGPMAGVIQGVAMLPEGDVRALANYVLSVMFSTGDNRHSVPAGARAVSNTPRADREGAGAGAAIYDSTCATCHDGSAALPFGGIQLTMSAAVSGATPLNLARVVLGGLHSRAGEAGPVMPGFASALTDEQARVLIDFIRAHFSDRMPWPEVAAAIRRARQAADD